MGLQAKSHYGLYTLSTTPWCSWKQISTRTVFYWATIYTDNRTVKNRLQWGRLEFYPWVRKIHWKKEWLSIPVFLPGEFHGQRSLASYSPWSCKESDTTEQPKVSLSLLYTDKMFYTHFLHSSQQSQQVYCNDIHLTDEDMKAQGDN